VRQVGQLPRIIIWCTVNETLSFTCRRFGITNWSQIQIQADQGEWRYTLFT